MSLEIRLHRSKEKETQQIHRSFVGHLGRLSEAQQGALEKFKTNLEKAGLYVPATETQEASHDDATVL